MRGDGQLAISAEKMSVSLSPSVTLCGLRAYLSRDLPYPLFSLSRGVVALLLPVEITDGLEKQYPSRTLEAAVALRACVVPLLC